MKRVSRIVFIVTMVLMGATSLSSCNALKKFLSTDLEDEDYIVGQLYADEYVLESPVKMRRKTESQAPSSVAGSRCGMELEEKDNSKLYEAIDAWFGTPYQYGGCSTSGVDCSCFVGNIYKTVYGVTLHRVASDIQEDVKSVKRSDLKEGDIVFFTNSNGKVSHVGIYLKDNLFVHSSTSNGVTISTLENSYWNKHFFKGGRHKAVKTNY